MRLTWLLPDEADLQAGSVRVETVGGGFRCLSQPDGVETETPLPDDECRELVAGLKRARLPLDGPVRYSRPLAGAPPSN